MVIFAPLYFLQKINIITENVHRVTSLMLLSKATDILKESRFSWNQIRRDKSGVWEEASDGKASAGLLLRAKLLFWWVSYSPKPLSLKKGRMMETALANCQLTPFFNEFSRSLWLSYPGDSGRVSVNSSWGCQNRKMGVHFLINENNNYVQMKAKRESKELPCYFKQRRVKALS